MANTDIKNLIERVRHWPEAAQDELFAVADQIESELHDQTYTASREELEAIDAAIADIDAGNIASEAEVDAAFAKFRRT